MKHCPDLPDVSAERLYAPADIVRSGLCIGCGGCAAAQPAASMEWDKDGFLKPQGPREWYEAPSDYLTRACPFSPGAVNEDVIAAERFPDATGADASIGRFEAAYVGHVADQPFRDQGSSGGLTTWVAAELLRTGAVDAVAHVVPTLPDETGRFFDYRVSRSVEALMQGAKSRYYPIELSRVLPVIRSTPERYAVVGIPCFIKAINLLRRSDPVLAERITHTLGLFCGHMKSAALVQSFAWQLQSEYDRVRAVDYRRKDAGRPANWYRAQLRLDDGATAEQDWWHLADGDWGAGFFQNPACDWCDDVVAETADISFGDAWVEPYSSDGRGTNVVVVRSKAMLDLIEAARADGRLNLEPVGPEFVIQTQAAGLRHRREGLAYRLSRRRGGIMPVKRVRASSDLPRRRKLIYRMRYGIARWTHRMFRLARWLQRPAIYLLWARTSLRIYQALAWSHGRLGRVFDAALPR
jgi:coenzyme F420-reducing hydrogenase beta subunit